MTEVSPDGESVFLVSGKLSEISSWLTLERIRELSGLVGKNQGELTGDYYELANLTMSQIPKSIKFGEKIVTPSHADGLSVKDLRSLAEGTDKSALGLCEELIRREIGRITLKHFLNARLTLAIIVWDKIGSKKKEEFWKDVLASQVMVSDKPIKPLDLSDENERWQFLAALFLLANNGVVLEIGTANGQK